MHFAAVRVMVLMYGRITTLSAFIFEREGYRVMLDKGIAAPCVRSRTPGRNRIAEVNGGVREAMLGGG
jgi:hypothetical protein